MINVEKTKTELNIDISKLRPSSAKKVYWNCQTCKIEQIKPFYQAKKTDICRPCSCRINGLKADPKNVSKGLKALYKSGYKHPLLGKPRPQHVKDAISKAHTGKCYLSEEQRKEFGVKNSGTGNPFFGKKHSKESLEKMSIASKKNVRRGKASNFYGKKYWTKKKYYYKDLKFKSNWEVLVARYLDTNNIRWEYEPKFFDLIDDTGKEMSYTPDFYLPDLNAWIEVKGYWYDDGEIKFNLFRLQYPNLIVHLYNESKLKELKIIK